MIIEESRICEHFTPKADRALATKTAKTTRFDRFCSNFCARDKDLVGRGPFHETQIVAEVLCFHEHFCTFYDFIAKSSATVCPCGIVTITATSCIVKQIDCNVDLYLQIWICFSTKSRRNHFFALLLCCLSVTIYGPKTRKRVENSFRFRPAFANFVIPLTQCSV